MIGRNPRRRICVKRLPRDHRRMTVYRFTSLLRRLQFFQSFFLTRDYGGIIHHFSQTEKQFTADLARRLLGVDRRAARFKGSRRHAGRKLQIYVDRIHAADTQARKRLFNILRPLDSAYVYNLVRIGNNPRRTVSRRKRRERLRRKQRTFHVNVRIY